MYFVGLTVSFHDLNALYGFMVFLVVISQIVSGTMLSFSLVPEPMMIPMVRDEEDLEDLYTDDFFWFHERGVDLVFIFSWLHLFRKLYMNVIEYEHEATWKSGVFTFLIFQVVVFCGLVLCCTHLSEITLTIAANIMHTFFLFHGKFYWWVFTDKQLNTDTLIRLAYAHYLAAFYMLYIAIIHAFDMCIFIPSVYIFFSAFLLWQYGCVTEIAIALSNRGIKLVVLPKNESPYVVFRTLGDIY